jgi:hypothetical protein
MCATPVGPRPCPPAVLPPIMQPMPRPMTQPFPVAPQPGVVPTVNVYHFNPVMQQRDIVQRFVECTQNDICQTALNAVTSYIGIPPEAVQAATSFATNGTSPPGSEETRLGINPPAGQSICALVVHPISVVPLDGDRATLFSLGVNPQHLDLMTWTPYRTQGRSWWDGTITVISIPDASVPQVRFCGRLKDQNRFDFWSSVSPWEHSTRDGRFAIGDGIISAPGPVPPTRPRRRGALHKQARGDVGFHEGVAESGSLPDD